MKVKKTNTILSEKTPNFVIKFAGPAVEDNKASKPYLIKKISLILIFLFF